MKKLSLFMLMAVGLLISSSMSAMPERPVPPTESQDVAEGGLKKEVPPTVPTSFTATPRKAAMGGDVATIIRDGVETPYADWATMMADVQDDDEIRLEANHTGAITLDKKVTLNLNNFTIDCSADGFEGTAVDVNADVTIKSGVIKANYYKTVYGLVVNSGTTTIENVLIKSQFTDSYGWGRYGVGQYAMYVYADASATIQGTSKLDGYYVAVYNCGTLTIKGNSELYAYNTAGISNEGNLNLSENVKVNGWQGVRIYKQGIIIMDGGSIIGSSNGIYDNDPEGATITVNRGEITGNNYGIYDAVGANITIKGGKIEGKNYYAIYSAKNGSLEMSAGELVGASYGVVFQSATSVSVSGGSITGNGAYGLYTNQTNTTLTGGRFKGTGTPDIYCYGGEISIKGGEYTRNDFEVDKGYAFASQDDPTYKYKVVASVAHIGGTVYGSLTEALTAAQTGDEVVVDNDITGDYIVTKAITLNTGKNTISGTVTADGVKVMVKGTGTINALAVANEGTFEIYSGTYPFDPTQYLADKISAMDNHDGTYTAGLFLARIGDDKYFFTLQEALDAVSENGVEPTEITVLQTIDNKVEIAIYGHRKTILNLNGHTLNMLGSTSLNISKNIEDNSYEPSAEDVFTVKNGVVNSPEGGVTFYAYGGVITVENLTINNSESSGLYTTDATTGTPVYNIGEGVVVNASCSFYTGTINMNAGEINGHVYNGGATFNMNGGSISSDKTNYCFCTVGENASLNISNGTLTNSYNGTTTEYYVVFNKGGNVSVTGGKFFVPIYGEDSQIRQIFYSDNSNFDIKGGTYNVSSNDAKFGNVALASGYYCMLAAEEGWFVVDNNAVAIVNNIAYATMDAAIAAAQPNSSRIVLIKDYDGDIAIAFNDTIDLRDYKVNGIIKATNGATVFVDGKTSASANGFDGDVKVLVGTYDFDPTAFLADNCSVDTETVPGKYIVTKGVVSYNGKLYASLADAVAATTNDPAVITVLRNFGLEAPLSIVSKKDITIELAGFTISNDRNHDANFSRKNLINNSGTLTIQDNTANEETGIGTGKIVYYPIDEDLDPYPHWTSDAIYNNGTIIVKSGIILNGGEKNGASASYAVDNAATSTLKISGGEIISNGNSYAIRLVYSATGNDILEATGGTLGSVWGQSNGDIAGGHIYLQNVTLLYGISLGYLGSPKFEVKLANVYIQNGKFVSEFNTSEEGSTDAVMIESYYLDHRFPHLSNGFFRFHDDYYHSNIYTSKVEQEKLVRPESEGWRYVQSETDPSITYIYMTAEGLLHYFHENLMPGYGLVPYINEAEGITAEDGWYKVVLAQGTTGEASGSYGELGNPWHQNKTWTLEEGKDVVPQDTTPVLIDHNVYVEENTNAIAASIQIEGGQTLTVKSGATLQILDAGALFKDETAHLIIEPDAVVTVGSNGVISQDMENILIEASATEVGNFLLHPDVNLNTQPLATVKMVANIGKFGASDYKWHRFAMPVEKLETPWTKIPSHPTLLYEWSYDKGDWDQTAGGSTGMKPFLGYTITTQKPVTDIEYTFTGNLLGNHKSEIDFQHLGYGYFGNSYTGYILAKEMLKGFKDVEGIEGQVWMWNAAQQSYTGVSLKDLWEHEDRLAAYEKEVAPMQTFILKTNTGLGATIDIDYMKAIWGNPRYGLVEEPNAAPTRYNAGNEDNAFAKIMITAANGQSDEVRLTENDANEDAYENGIDATKYFNENHINVFASVESENYTSLYTNSLLDKEITLQTLDEVAYTLSVECAEGDKYALQDLMTGTIIPLVQGATYNFAAQSNTTSNRFRVVGAHNVTTGTQNLEAQGSVKGIYTILGQYVGETVKFNTLSAGVYVVDGVKFVK